MTRRIFVTFSAVVVCVISSLSASTLYGQQGLLDALQSSTRLDRAGPKVVAQLDPVSGSSGEQWRLSVTVTVAPGNYTYSMNSDFGGRTQITVTQVNGLVPREQTFQPDRAPKAVFEPLLGQELEKFYDRVTWSRTYQRDPAVPVSQIRIEGTIDYQVCDERSCRQFSNTFQVAVAGPETDTASQPPPPTLAASPAHEGSMPRGDQFQLEVTPTRGQGASAKPEPITWRFQLEPSDAQPDDQVTLTLTATPEPDWYIYAQTQDPANYGNPTVITIQHLVGLKPVDAGFTPDREPETKTTFDGKEQKIHHGPITWTRRFAVLPSVPAGAYGAQGKVQYQICDPQSCRAGSVAFTLGAVADVAPSEGSSGIEASSGTAVGALDLSNLHVQRGSASSQQHLVVVLVTAFVAGFILNFMPCVLPVIGLKIMAFVQQAGDSRGRIFLLNLWFALGLMSVFMVLASLAVFLGLGWGAQFTSAGFNIALTGVVFAFALSFLGVWEIPIPGFAGSGTAAQLAEREGIAGAFFKGVLTTVLATPCSGPMLGPALTWAVSQPPAITYLGFTAVGLGMATPYLVIGAFPQTLSFLPKPGAWMETFKNLMGFVLLGTVVFLLTFLQTRYVVATIAFLFGLWAACWWIGRTSLTEPFLVKLKAWAVAALVAASVGWISFGWLSKESEITWRPFTLKALDQSVAKKKTVLVDFTADW